MNSILSFLLHALLLSHLKYNTLTKINETAKLLNMEIIVYVDSKQKGADQNLRMRRLISVFLFFFRICLKQILFSRRGSNVLIYM